MRSIAATFLLCLFLPLLSQAHHTPKWASRNLKTISTIYNLTVYPNNVGLFFGNGTNAIPAGLFNENATGRIDPVGTFVDFQDSVEYFFGLAPTAPTSPSNGVFESAEVVEFQSGCPEVASSTVYLTLRVYNPGQPDDGKFLATLKELAYWRFDKNGAVLKYDAWIPNLRPWAAISTGYDISSVEAQAPTIQGLCGAIQQRCVGPNTQYDSLATCVSTLSKKPFGDFDEAWGDNVVCRTIHVLLTKIRPEVHCPHVGPTGGMKCIDISYNDAYFNDEALFGDTLAKTFMCP